MAKVSSIGGAGPGALAGGGAGGAGGHGNEGDGDDNPQASQPDADTDPAILASTMPDTDVIETRPDAPGPRHRGAAAGLPTDEAVMSNDQQVAAIRAQFDEAMGAFQFMGTAHPRYASVKAKIEQLEAMLGALEG